MKRFLVLLCVLFPMVLFAQRIVSLLPLEADNSRHKFIVLSASTEISFEFHFSGSKKNNPYSGFVSVVIWAKTNVSGDLPSTVVVDADPMFYDAVSNAWEIAAGQADVISIESSFDFELNHSNNVYSISRALNILGADGLVVNINNQHVSETMEVRVELRMAEDR